MNLIFHMHCMLVEEAHVNISCLFQCIEKMSKANCPVCLEDIHTSRIVSHVPPCGHLIHRPCFHDLIKAGFYACPTCGTSMIKMKEVCINMFMVQKTLEQDMVERAS